MESRLVIYCDSDRVLSAAYDGEPVGKIELCRNRFHKQNQYLRLHLADYENAWVFPLFSQIQQAVGKPLQVMVSSEDSRQAELLRAGGFSCVRKCYELEVTSKDYIASNVMLPLESAKQGQPEYTSCCQLLYDYYRDTHAAINPLTADFSEFCEELPVEVFYEKNGEEIRHFAFVEGSEIAYIGSVDVGVMRPFAESIVCMLFAKFESISFECDDCDTAAMTLKDLFCFDPNESYDTYIRRM